MTGDVKSENKQESNKCAFCRAPASLLCNRCGDFYCSPECQKSDWQRHRYICFPMASLRLVDDENDGKSARPKTAESGTQAGSVKSNGHVDVKPQSIASTLKIEFPKVEALPTRKPEVPIKVEIETPPPTPTPVESASTPSAASKLSALRRPMSRPLVKPAAPKKTMLDNLKVREFSGPKVKVHYLALPEPEVGNMFVICEDKYYDEFQEISTKVQAHCATQVPGYEPEVNEVVLCFFHDDELWYRAVCSGAKNEKGEYPVYFIEFGNQENVRSENLMKMPDSLIIDMISKTILVKNAPKDVNDLNEKQTEMLEQIFTITDIKEAEGGVFECQIFGF